MGSGFETSLRQLSCKFRNLRNRNADDIRSRSGKPLIFGQIFSLLSMKKQALSLLLISAAFAGCTSTTEKNTTVENSTPAAAAQLRFAPVPASPDFPDAMLSISKSSSTVISGSDSATLKFNFKVSNYELMAQTSDAAGKQCNNSNKGQHIHFILDNAPYVALYKPEHETKIARNSEHYLLCFLSRSYHESVKAPGAHVLIHFKIDDKGAMQMLEAPKAPMLFYSRPKGDYMGKDTANLLLDFYVANGTLSNDMKVEAMVENTTTGAKGAYTFTEWKSMFVEGMGTGVAKVNLRLVDGAGKLVAGPQSEVTRENIRLAAAEPMP